MRSDLVCGGLGLALAATYFAAAGRLPVSLLSDAVGADGVPKALAVTLALLSVLLLLRAAMRRPSGGAATTMAAHGRSLGLLGLGAAYVAVAPGLGYPLAIAALIGVAASYFGQRPDFRLASVSILGAALFWAVFVKMLGVAMPIGAWPRLLS